MYHRNVGCSLVLFFFLIWMATWNNWWLEFGDITFILYHKIYFLMCLPEKEEISLWLLSWRIAWTHTSIFQETQNVHLKASDHRHKRRWGMKKCSYNLMPGVLLWEQSPYVLVPQEQCFSWNQTLFSSVRYLGSWSRQCTYLPLIPELQSISDGTLVLCLSLIETAGYKVLFCSGFGFLAYNAPSPSVTSAKILCQSLCVWLLFGWAFFFFFFYLPACEGSFVSI